MGTVSERSQTFTPKDASRFTFPPSLGLHHSEHPGIHLARYTPKAYSRQMFTFVESSIFERIRPVYLDDDEYSELQQFLMQNPEAGELVPGLGGVRKVRWARPGMGKRGGLRVIYFVRYQPNEFWMLTLYAKAKREDVPGHILKQLLEAFRDG